MDLLGRTLLPQESWYATKGKSETAIAWDFHGRQKEVEYPGSLNTFKILF